MGQPSVTQLIQYTREQMDAVGSDRWSDDEIKQMLNLVYDSEWGRLLASVPYYNFNQVSVTTDANGQFTLASLDTGTGDSAKNFFRILSVNDGNVEYQETRFQDVPLAVVSSYRPYYRKMFYLAGDYYQTLPAAATPLNVVVNWKPTAINDLASNASLINYPLNNHLILCMSAAARLLKKGGAESNQADILQKMADDERGDMLDDLRRRTINPTRLAYPDRASDWGA